MSTLNPEVGLHQRLSALDVANQKRIGMANVRREIKALPMAEGRAKVAAMLEDPSELVLKMRVGYLLSSIRHAGYQKVSGWCRHAYVRSLDRRVEELSERQRFWIAAALRAGGMG